MTTQTFLIQSPDQLLEDFLCSRASLFQIAAAHGLSIDQLIAWYRDEATQARIQTLKEMAEAQQTLTAKFHSAAAIDRLATIVDTEDNINPVERRRAAGLVLKHAPVQRQPKKQSGRAPQVARLSEACETESSTDTPDSKTATPQSSHEPPAHDPTHTSHESHPSHDPSPQPIHSPLNDLPSRPPIPAPPAPHEPACT